MKIYDNLNIAGNLCVAGDASFCGRVSVLTPEKDSHAVTKEYADNRTAAKTHEFINERLEVKNGKAVWTIDLTKLNQTYDAVPFMQVTKDGEIVYASTKFDRDAQTITVTIDCPQGTTFIPEKTLILSINGVNERLTGVNDEGLSYTEDSYIKVASYVEIDGYRVTKEDFINPHQHFEFTTYDELSGCESKRDGDTAVVKSLIEGTGTEGIEAKYSYTGYVYDEGAWKPMDGNYSAKNVYMSGCIRFTENIGTVKIPEGGCGYVDVCTDNQTVEDFLISLVQKEDTNVQKIQPSISFTCITEGGEYEVGTTVSIGYTISTNQGEYKYGPDTCIEFKDYKIEAFNGDTCVACSDGESGTLTFRVEDEMTIKLKATATHSSGCVPNSNIGNPLSDQAFLSGEKTAEVENVVTAFRGSFFGYNKNDDFFDPDKIDSSYIRGLEGFTVKSKFAVGDEFSIPAEPVKRIFFAIPKDTYQNYSFKVAQTIPNANIPLTEMIDEEIHIKGEGGYPLSIQYRVFYHDFTSPVEAGQTFRITEFEK